MSYTERFTERHCPLARINPASYTTEQNTARAYVGNYHRVFVLLIVGAMAANATLDVDVEQHTASAGGSTKNVTSHSITQLTQAGGDGNQLVGIEIQTEELDVNNGYDYLSVEVTPAVGAVICGCILFGIIPRYAPVAATAWAEVVD